VPTLFMLVTALKSQEEYQANKTGLPDAPVLDHIRQILFDTPVFLWMANSLTMAAIRKFKNADGDLIWRPGLAEGQPQTILGYAAVEAQDMPDVATNTFPIAFGNFSRGYLIVDRFGTRILRDPYSNKPYVQFYATKRVGGAVVDSEAIKVIATRV
jgi:HK97 family phage major capsid protein